MKRIIHLSKPNLISIRRNLIINDNQFKFLLSPNIYNQVDKNILSITNSASVNYLMSPLIGFIDAFWVSRLGTSQQLAGQGFADDVYNLIFSIFCFFSSFITPEISKLNSDKEKDQDNIISLISTTIMCSFLIGSFISILINLVVVGKMNLFINNPTILSNSKQYLGYRSLTIGFAMMNNSIFAVLRGLFLFKTAFKLNLLSQVVNIILDPIFMYFYGLKGIAIASCLSEVICSVQYVNYLNRNKYLTLKLKGLFKILKKIFNTGILIQIRNICYKLIYLLMLNKILKIDYTGKLVAAYVICSKIMEIGNIFYYGLGTVGYTLIPTERSQGKIKKIESRLFRWGNLFLLVEFLFIGNFYLTSSLLSNDLEVVKLIKKSLPYIFSLLYVQGLGNIYDGILQGYQKFKYQSITSFISLVFSVGLFYISSSFYQIWFSIISVYFIRLIGLYLFRQKINK